MITATYIYKSGLSLQTASLAKDSDLVVGLRPGRTAEHPVRHPSMAVSINWGSSKGSYKAPLGGWGWFEVDIRQVQESILIRNILQFS